MTVLENQNPTGPPRHDDHPGQPGGRPAGPPPGPGPAGPGPAMFLQLATGFWPSKVLLTAVELGVFDLLADGPHSGQAIQAKLDLHPRGVADFLDTLVALGILNRTNGLYTNHPATAAFLTRSSPSSICGFVEMANSRLYPFWERLGVALRTGEPQNEAREGRDFFKELYEDPDALGGFLDGMASSVDFIAAPIIGSIDWTTYDRFIDVGGAGGALSIRIAKAMPHLSGGVFDLPAVGPHFARRATEAGLGDRLEFTGGDFFADPLPETDVVIMGHVLHDWNLEEKQHLVRSAFKALPTGGSLIVYDPMLDPERRENLFGLLMSLNMLIETQGGFEYRVSEIEAWMRDAGFRQITVHPTPGPDTIVVAVK